MKQGGGRTDSSPYGVHRRFVSRLDRQTDHDQYVVPGAILRVKSRYKPRQMELCELVPPTMSDTLLYKSPAVRLYRNVTSGIFQNVTAGGLPSEFLEPGGRRVRRSARHYFSVYIEDASHDGKGMSGARKYIQRPTDEGLGT